MSLGQIDSNVTHFTRECYNIGYVGHGISDCWFTTHQKEVHLTKTEIRVWAMVRRERRGRDAGPKSPTYIKQFSSVGKGHSLHLHRTIPPLSVWPTNLLPTWSRSRSPRTWSDREVKRQLRQSLHLTTSLSYDILSTPVRCVRFGKLN